MREVKQMKWSEVTRDEMRKGSIGEVKNNVGEVR